MRLDALNAISLTFLPSIKSGGFLMSEVVVICHRCRAEDRPDHTRTYKDFANYAYCVCGTALQIRFLRKPLSCNCMCCHGACGIGCPGDDPNAEEEGCDGMCLKAKKSRPCYTCGGIYLVAKHSTGPSTCMNCPILHFPEVDY